MPDWEALVRQNGPMVFRVAWRILGDAQDAEDVGQEVFLELHRLLETRQVESYGGLLRRMTTLRALDRLRRRKCNVSLEDVSLAATRDNPEAEAIRKERTELLRAAIARLPEREGTVFCLRYFENLSNLEIAESLKVSPSAVSTALHRARINLESLLGETMKEDWQ